MDVAPVDLRFVPNVAQAGTVDDGTATNLRQRLRLQMGKFHQ